MQMYGYSFGMRHKIFGVEAITVAKVMAHATDTDVELDRSTPMDKWGNDHADKAAKRGAFLHPDVSAHFTIIDRQRTDAGSVVRWIARGLEAAEGVGSLPPKLTIAEKEQRPREKTRVIGDSVLEVVPDAEWRSLQRVARQIEKVHLSHRLQYLDPFVFCSRCGSYSSSQVRALGEKCSLKASSSKLAFLVRLRNGCHPRTGVPLGEPRVLDVAALRLELASFLRLAPS